MPTGLKNKIQKLQGPILVLGASGFIGANLLKIILYYRKDVFGTGYSSPVWRLEDIPQENVVQTDFLMESHLLSLLNDVKPRTVFNCVAYGSYSFETDTNLIYQTNVNFTVKLFEELSQREVVCCVHAGSSSEYGDKASRPTEETSLTPNSHYAVSKAAVSKLIYYFGKKQKFPCAELRLYSVYGPLEDSSRLIPAIIINGVKGGYPEFVDPDISRDFVFVEDACEAFIDAALNLKESHYGESFNIGTGERTSIGDIAMLAKEIFQISADPKFTMPKRDWDMPNWFANPEKAKIVLGWEAGTSLREGLKKTLEWYKSIEDTERYHKSSKQFGPNIVHSISAIIPCYKDAQAIPIMYERLTKVFSKLGIDYEIIFVNDNSPDNSEEVIRAITSRDRRVIGISHSRNFGSQAAFRSGMGIATKNACVLLDGDLQDPPEVIEQFVEKWREGYDVVYGRRIKRKAPLHMRFFYKLFYRLFDAFSYIRIPHDAGDFSLIDRKVVRCLLKFPERDLFVRGVRAFVGFEQTGVDYVRPERKFGATTNTFLMNVKWAKKGILSFTNTPLNMLSFLGVALLGLTFLVGLVQIVLKLLFPEIVPEGLTTTILAILFFGSLNLFAISLLGEYIAKIFEEVKRRPHFLVRNVIREGQVQELSEGANARRGEEGLE